VKGLSTTPTVREIEIAEEESVFAERAYRQKLANLIAMATATLAAAPADAGLQNDGNPDSAGETLDPPLSRAG